jgi:hypothetical protein
MPPPQPCGVPFPLFTPEKIAQVANAPISNSLGLKYSGAGGGGATTCFEDEIGSPAKVVATCEAMPIMVKAIIFFITIGLPRLMTGTP